MGTEIDRWVKVFKNGPLLGQFLNMLTHIKPKATLRMLIQQTDFFFKTETHH